MLEERIGQERGCRCSSKIPVKRNKADVYKPHRSPNLKPVSSHCWQIRAHKMNSRWSQFSSQNRLRQVVKRRIFHQQRCFRRGHTEENWWENPSVTVWWEIFSLRTLLVLPHIHQLHWSGPSQSFLGKCSCSLFELYIIFLVYQTSVGHW